MLTQDRRITPMQVSPRSVAIAALAGLGGIGLSVGVAIELHNHRERDLAAAVEHKCREQASWYRAQVAICSDSIERGRSYPAVARQSIFQSATRSLGVEVDGVAGTDWSTELPHHRHWLTKRTIEADQAALRKLDYQRWLFWPY